MKRLILLACLTLCIAFAMPLFTAMGDSVAFSLYAATPQQKAKERREAARKAQAKRAKEAAKRQKQRKKEQAKRDRENAKRRETAAKLRAKRSGEQAEQARLLAKKYTAQDNSAAAEAAAYQQLLAAVQRRNNKIAGYNSRDIAHRFGFWGQGGYSSFFLPSSPGFAGGGGGLGYQVRYKLFLFTTGAEFMSYNAMVDPQLKGQSKLWATGFVQIPVLVGMELPYWYWLVGGKAGYGLIGSAPLSQLSINAAVSAEIGMNFDPYSQVRPKRGKRLTDAEKMSNRFHYRLALFADYGGMDVCSHETLPILNEWGVHPFIAGVKLSIWYQHPRKNKKLLPLPRQPRPRLAVIMKDEESGNQMAGVQLAMHNDVNGTTMTKNSSAKMPTITRLTKSVYTLTARKVGYFASDTVHYTLDKDLRDTVIMLLRPKPESAALSFSGFVVDDSSHKALDDVEIRVTALVGDTGTLYSSATNEEGLFVTDLYDGKYLVYMHKEGYMPQVDTVNFTTDTLRFSLRPIKRGIRVRIDNLFFATARTKILPSSEKGLADLARFLKQNPTVKIRIIGHTDNVGSGSFNQTLSDGRAHSVMLDLVARGVEPDRMEWEGRGFLESVASNDTPEGRQLNRRVEFEITDTQGVDITQVYDDTEKVD